MKRMILIALPMVILGSMLSTAKAATKYWDINGDVPGAGQDGGGFSDGDWNLTTPNWSTSAAGSVATEAWVVGDGAVFSAGSDATDALINVAAGVAPASVTIEDGIVTLQGTALAIGGNPIRVNQGATLVLPTQFAISVGTSAGHVLTLDGGTLHNQQVGLGTGIYTSPAANPTQIQLTSNGGTLQLPNGPNDAYSIMQYGSATSAAIIGLTSGTTSATLRKIGAGEFRALNNWTFTGLEVQQGLYRINGTGGGETGFGAPTGTVTTNGGAVENTTNGSALGTSAGLTGAAASPVTRSFVLGGTGDTMIVLNASWTINGPIGGPGGLMLNGWARNDGGGTTSIIGTQTPVLTLGGTNTYAGPTTINFATVAVAGGAAIPDTSKVAFSTRSAWGGNNGGVTSTFDTAVFRVDASETIGSLEGGNVVRGVVNINGPTVALTTGAAGTSTAFDGSITGTGGLTKIGAGTFSMNGVKSYSGDTKVEGGVLSTNSASLADLADVYLTTGGGVNLNFAGIDVIDSLFINGVSQAIGTWGGAGSGAANISVLLSGTGLLQVSTLVSAGVSGDYNDNGAVDAADYTVWRDNLNANVTLPNDSTPGTVTEADFDVWKTNFGMMGGGGSLGAAAVPEPSSLLLMLCAMACMQVFRRRR